MPPHYFFYMRILYKILLTAVLVMIFNVHDWEKVNSTIYRNRHTWLTKSKVTFSLEQQAELEFRDFIFDT